jgi:hypothetical protein
LAIGGQEADGLVVDPHDRVVARPADEASHGGHGEERADEREDHALSTQGLHLLDGDGGDHAGVASMRT